jgi:hypothetical protein
MALMLWLDRVQHCQPSSVTTMMLITYQSLASWGCCGLIGSRDCITLRELLPALKAGVSFFLGPVSHCVHATQTIRRCHCERRVGTNMQSTASATVAQAEVASRLGKACNQQGPPRPLDP